MSRSALKAGKKPWKKTDQDLLVIKQGQITTTFGQRQIYKIRIARWGKFQAVLQKRLFRFDKELMDYIPGRSMGFNLQDLEIILQNQTEILNVLKETKQNINQDQVYKSKKIAQRKQKQENE